LVREKNKAFNGKKSIKFYIMKGEITMDNNEIMVNEEVMEATEIATSGAGKGFKIAAGIGLAALGSVITYKYVVKPIVAKIKAKKAQQKIGGCEQMIHNGESINREDDEFEEFDETTE
jgi:hypothetical protein